MIPEPRAIEQQPYLVPRRARPCEEIRGDIAGRCLHQALTYSPRPSYKTIKDITDELATKQDAAWRDEHAYRDQEEVSGTADMSFDERVAMMVAAYNAFCSVRYVRLPQMMDDLMVTKDEE
jgi:hypothetical protein